MNPFSLLKYPAYIYNPRQILTRLKREFAETDDDDLVQLPWGHWLSISSKEFIGNAIWKQGIHEINVCEAIARLVRRGDNVIDVGANVGFTTSLFSKAVGNTGHVLALEPHPDLYRKLQLNISRFDDGRSGQITARRLAISNYRGEGEFLWDPDVFARNSGTAGLRDHGFAQGQKSFAVPTDKLDNLIGDETIGLLKVDVEGAELHVLKGAETALSRGRIRAVVYEDFSAGSSGIASYLNQFGFSVFYLRESIFRPLIQTFREPFAGSSGGRDENFLAVLDVSAVQAAYNQSGWRVFDL